METLDLKMKEKNDKGKPVFPLNPCNKLTIDKVPALIMKLKLMLKKLIAIRNKEEWQ